MIFMTAHMTCPVCMKVTKAILCTDTVTASPLSFLGAGGVSFQAITPISSGRWHTGELLINREPCCSPEHANEWSSALRLAYDLHGAKQEERPISVPKELIDWMNKE